MGTTSGGFNNAGTTAGNSNFNMFSTPSPSTKKTNTRAEIMRKLMAGNNVQTKDTSRISFKKPTTPTQQRSNANPGIFGLFGSLSSKLKYDEGHNSPTSEYLNEINYVKHYQTGINVK